MACQRARDQQLHVGFPLKIERNTPQIERETDGVRNAERED